MASVFHKKIRKMSKNYPQQPILSGALSHLLALTRSFSDLIDS